MVTYRNRSGGSIIPEEISGLRVVQQRRSKKERAELGAAILRGETTLRDLTQGQVAKICNVSPAYIQKVQHRDSAPVVQLAAE